ncbi:hypothetical protein [Microbacterium dextranolyticum]|uniref:Uncharacterized protein n=1 Tax=Microbacterium dextranolyticum TaxID=36806 RepID=A0A9W6HQ01_9MICO|nr:hypothetical protein [Microbacterium dextranolyticum]MBM7464092.1 energy-converting hydrogenase Eha subunit B [Microbacterium dextranolyticum]GLJ96580.1 hypothetical protein GCM10017591_26430 [Microbacterium dextranolyticum]
MIDAISGLVRAMLAMLGLLALADPAATGSLSAVAVLVLAVALLVVAVIAASVAARGLGARIHPTRRAELRAPLTQSDPAAPGHVRRRGPGRAVAAA